MILTSTSQLGYSPKRIISLVPSQTELLHHLGLGKRIIGITKFCIHPKHLNKNIPKIGGTKNINIKKIHELNPDLIIANKEENVKEQIEELAVNYPVWVTNVDTFESALKMIKDLGKLTGKTKPATALASEIKKECKKIKRPLIKLPVAYLIWRNPYMSAGGDTFISNILALAGLKNVFAKQKRYPKTAVDELKASKCKYILLSTEPYPFKEKHIEELQEQFPGVKVILANGEMFSWFGSRMLLLPPYLKDFLKNFEK